MENLIKIRNFINKLIENEPKQEKYDRDYFRLKGIEGGNKVKETNLAKDPDYYKKMGAKGVEARKNKKISTE